MSLSPRRIATLGLGFGALSVAYLGLWPVAVTPPVTPPSGAVRGGSGGYVQVLAYEPAVREVRLALIARENKDSARILIGVDPALRVPALVLDLTERQPASVPPPVLRAVITVTEGADAGILAVTADWSDDDDEAMMFLPVLLS